MQREMVCLLCACSFSLSFSLSLPLPLPLPLSLSLSHTHTHTHIQRQTQMFDLSLVSYDLSIPLFWSLGVLFPRSKLYPLHTVHSLTQLNMRWPWIGAYNKKDQIAVGKSCIRFQTNSKISLYLLVLKIFINTTMIYFLCCCWTGYLEFLQRQGDELRKLKASLKSK